MRNIKKIILSNRKILENFSYLSILQIVNLLIPFLTYPYLIRVLGSSIYGKVIFAQALMAYFSIIINFGFNISGTKEIAVHSDNKEKLSEILSSIFQLKIILWLICFAILIICIFFINPFNNNKILYLLSFCACFNELLFHQFFFQGLEKMKYITIINFISRFFFFILIFLLIKDTNDYLYVPLLNGLGATIGGVMAFYLVVYKEKMVLSIQSVPILKKYFKESSSFFFSRFSSIIIARSNIMILGAFVGYTEVAYYDLAQKIQTMSLMPFGILNDVLYPNISRTKNMLLIKKVLKAILVLFIFFFILMIIFVPNIVHILGGSEMERAHNIILILFFSIVFIASNYFLGNTVLVVNGYSNYFNNSVLYSALLYLLLVSVLYITSSINLYTLAFLGVIVDLYCYAYRIYFVQKLKLLN